MKKYVIISPEFGLEKGGIQVWGYYIHKSLIEAGFLGSVFDIYKKSFKDLTNLILGFFSSRKYLLMTWKMSFLILPVYIFNFLIKKDDFYVFVHGNDFLNLNVLKKKYFKFFINSPKTKVIANSQAIASLFEKEMKYKVDSIFYPFVDFPSVKKEELTNLRNDILSISTITRLVERKNIISVIRAIKILKDKGVHVNYKIGGVGPEFEKIAQLIKTLELSNQIELLGKVEENNKWNIISQSDFFILPSYFNESDGSIEGYGIVYIEANAMGIPVISGNSGGIVEAVIDKKTGIMSDGSVENIANILEAVNDKAYLPFDSNFLISHANKHKYNNQSEFIDYIYNKRLS
ncbi:TPA: glycosyltransferase [Photobacterium damselae]